MFGKKNKYFNTDFYECRISLPKSNNGFLNFIIKAYSLAIKEDTYDNDPEVLFFDTKDNEVQIIFNSSNKEILIINGDVTTGFVTNKDIISEVFEGFQAIEKHEKTKLRLTTAGVMTKGLSKAAGRDFLSDMNGTLSRNVAEYAGLKSPKSPY